MKSKERGHERWPVYDVRIRLMKQRAVSAAMRTVIQTGRQRERGLGIALCRQIS
jgi:hypothetical protein